MSAVQIITASLDDLRQIVREELSRAGTVANRGKELLSKRAAAAFLGVDRKTTLENLIQSGQIPTVSAGKQTRIVRSVLVELLENGFSSGPKRKLRHPRAHGSPSSCNSAAIRAIDIGKL